MNRMLDITTSMFASVSRLGAGVAATPPTRRPVQLLEVYEFESCPFCRKVRDALTERVLAAENVTSSETAVMKARLSPVVALGVKVLGTITDAQESELLAVKELWPQVPHQVCQFHALRDAAQPAYAADKQVKTAMRKALQPKVRALRKQLKRDIPRGAADEANQLGVLDDYASAVLTALNRDGIAPLDFAAVQTAKDLDEVEASLQRLAKKGGL